LISKALAKKKISRTPMLKIFGINPMSTRNTKKIISRETKLMRNARAKCTTIKR